MTWKVFNLIVFIVYYCFKTSSDNSGWFVEIEACEFVQWENSSNRFYRKELDNIYRNLGMG